MAPVKALTGALLLVLVYIAFRNDVPSRYRAVFGWFILAVALAAICFYAGLAFRESFETPYVYLLLAACTPLVMLGVMSGLVKLVELKLNRPVELMLPGGQDRYLSAVLIAVFGLCGAAMGLLLRHAP